MKISLLTLKPNRYKNTYYKAKPQISQNTYPVFLGVQCQEKNFQLKNVKNLHCPICGLVMLNNAQKNDFINDVSGKTGEELIEALSKYDDETVLVGDDFKNEHKTIYRPIKAKVIEVIKESAKEYPKLNLLQLVKLKKEEYLEPLIKEQLKVTSELEDYLEKVSITEEEKANIYNLIEEFKKQIKGESETEFKRKNYIHAFGNVVSNPKIQEKIIEILEKLPKSTNDVNSFFVKYSKEAKSAKEIASKFVEQSIPSAEHLLPKSKGGKDNTSNYICDCAECNSLRSDIDFDVWLKQKPQIAKGLQRYIYVVQKVIDEGNFRKEYNDYVEDIIKTIHKLSYGKLKLRAPKSTNEEINRVIYAKRLEEIENIKRKVGELHQRKNQLKTQIRELEANPQFNNIVQLEIFKKQICISQKKLSSIESELLSQQKIKQDALKILTEATRLRISLEKEDNEETRKQLADLDELSQKKILASAEEKIKTLEISLNNTKNNITKLQKKAATLQNLVTSTDELAKEIEAQQKLLEQANIILAQIEKVKKEIEFETRLNKSISDLDIEIAKLEELNKELELNLENSQTSDMQPEAQYEQYCENLELLKVGQDIMEYAKTQRSKMPALSAKFLSKAQELIKEKTLELVEKDGVKYYKNKAKIESIEHEKEDCKKQLEAIEQLKAQLKKLEKELENVLQGTTLDELTKSLEYLKKQKQTIEEIQKISEYRVELEIIEDTINYNDGILKQLRNFKNMSNEQFQDCINMIFY